MSSRTLNNTGSAGFPESSFRHSPLMHVRWLFVRFAQGLFYYSPPGNYHWSPDLETTEIVITDENPINIDVVGKRPAMTFTRGPVQFYSLGMDDRLGYRADIDRKTKSVLIPGTMSVNVCSRNDLESEHLAFVFAETLWLLREDLMREGFFEIGRQPQISAPSPAGAIVVGDMADEWFCTTVSCPFQFYRTSAVTPLNKDIANNLRLGFTTRSRTIGSLGLPANGVNGPFVTSAEFPPSFAPDASDATGGTPNPAGTNEYSLSKQPHPLNPATEVVVRTVYPGRAGIKSY